MVIFRAGWSLRRCALQPPAYEDISAPAEREAQPLLSTLADAGPDAALRAHRFQWGRSGRGLHVRFPFVLRRRLRLGRCVECLLRQAWLDLATHTTPIAPHSPRRARSLCFAGPRRLALRLVAAQGHTKASEYGHEVNQTAAMLTRLGEQD